MAVPAFAAVGIGGMISAVLCWALASSTLDDLEKNRANRDHEERALLAAADSSAKKPLLLTRARYLRIASHGYTDAEMVADTLVPPPHPPSLLFSPADLWEQKRNEGLSEESATAFVERRLAEVSWERGSWLELAAEVAAGAVCVALVALLPLSIAMTWWWLGARVGSAR